jgi:hypothetical protein
MYLVSGWNPSILILECKDTLIDWKAISCLQIFVHENCFILTFPIIDLPIAVENRHSSLQLHEYSLISLLAVPYAIFFRQKLP